MITDGIKTLLISDHPVLATVAKYFFDNDGGKKVRPVMVLLVSSAIQAHRYGGEVSNVTLCSHGALL